MNLGTRVLANTRVRDLEHLHSVPEGRLRHPQNGGCPTLVSLGVLKSPDNEFSLDPCTCGLEITFQRGHGRVRGSWVAIARRCGFWIDFTERHVGIQNPSSRHDHTPLNVVL